MKSWVQEGGAITRDEQRAEVLLEQLRNEPFPGQRLKCEPVRTSFDDVYPGMPPAIKLSTT